MIKAYTLIEMAVGMLLAAITISVCYTAYGIITSYMVSFQHKNSQAEEVLSFRHAFEHDLQFGNLVLKNEGGLVIFSDTTRVSYHFSERFITRKLNEGQIDTFKLAEIKTDTFFEGAPVMGTDTIDQLNLSVVLGSQLVPMQFHKTYSSVNLFK